MTNIINPYILYDNIVGPINPSDNFITKLNYSDHYLLYKKIILHNNKILHLFNINIAQRNVKSSILKQNRLNIPLRSKENIEILMNYKTEIINFIIEISKIKHNKLKKYKNELESDTNLYKIINKNFKKYYTGLKILKIIVKKIHKDYAPQIIKENLELDNDEYYYYFDLIFEEETLKDYKNRINKCFYYIIKTIRKISDGVDNYYVINTQEFNPYYLIYNEINNFIIKLYQKLGINFKLIVNNNDLLNETTSVSFVSINTNYKFKSITKDLLIDFMKYQNKITSPTKYLKFSYYNLPIIYNLHTKLYNHDEIIELLKILRLMDNFIICGDLNLKLQDNKELINKLVKTYNKFNINIELTATPEANYLYNYFTYDVIIYKL